MCGGKLRAHHSYTHTNTNTQSDTQSRFTFIMTLMVAWRHGGATNEGTNTHAEDDEICSDNSNDVYCRIKFKQMINFCHVFAFSSVILAHIVERQSDFNKDLFSVPIEKSTNECVRV